MRWGDYIETDKDFEDGASDSDSESADSSSIFSEVGYEDELESTYAVPTRGFLEDLELDDLLRIPVAELQPASHSESTIVELEEYQDAELPVDERGAELQRAYKVIEDQQRELEAKRQELEVRNRELEEQNRKLEERAYELEERQRELEELRAFKSSRTRYDEGGCHWHGA